jgi:hypothetical protein
MIGAMSTGAAATGTRSYIATRHFSWMTPRRMKLITASLLGSALFASSFIFGGSTPSPQTAAAHPASASPAAVVSHAASR